MIAQKKAITSKRVKECRFSREWQERSRGRDDPWGSAGFHTSSTEDPRLQGNRKASGIVHLHEEFAVFMSTLACFLEKSAVVDRRGLSVMCIAAGYHLRISRCLLHDGKP
ncbi:uncharacterized protein BDV17DRAFT_73066 [Aspergillus undulatus]|uniref:uncharacterized protein n=1 Tax=Aspergillus undulatus TaxID=1810928 RepID=UPI003CCCEE10